MTATLPPGQSHPASLSPDVLLRRCKLRFGRRSGPGGQHRNKVETAVIITDEPTGLAAEASERRSQAENRGVAMFRLRLRLALSVRAAVDPASGPSGLWQSRCRGGRLAVNPEHDDFPALLAELLDALHAAGDDLPVVAARMGISTSQIVKLLKLAPEALEQLNRRRGEKGLRPLR